MKKFEYHTADASVKNVLEVLNILGSQGWEVVFGETSVINSERLYHFVFKREKK